VSREPIGESGLVAAASSRHMGVTLSWVEAASIADGLLLRRAPWCGGRLSVQLHRLCASTWRPAVSRSHQPACPQQARVASDERLTRIGLPCPLKAGLCTRPLGHAPARRALRPMPDHELEDRPDQGIPVGRALRRPVDVRRECGHLLLELGEHAHVVHPTLLIQGADRFGARQFAVARVDLAHRQVGLELAQELLHQVAAVVRLGDDAVGVPAVVERDHQPAPVARRVAATAVVEHVAVLIDSQGHDADAGLIGVLPAAHGGVDGDDHALPGARCQVAWPEAPRLHP
jgi:hypothetical protein